MLSLLAWHMLTQQAWLLGLLKPNMRVGVGTGKNKGIVFNTYQVSQYEQVVLAERTSSWIYSIRFFYTFASVILMHLSHPLQVSSRGLDFIECPHEVHLPTLPDNQVKCTSSGEKVTALITKLTSTRESKGT